MSVIVSTPTQICNSPLNQSKAKFLYSFPKASKDNLVRKSEYTLIPNTLSLHPL